MFDFRASNFLNRQATDLRCNSRHDWYDKPKILESIRSINVSRDVFEEAGQVVEDIMSQVRRKNASYV